MTLLGQQGHAGGIDGRPLGQQEVAGPGEDAPDIHVVAGFRVDQRAGGVPRGLQLFHGHDGIGSWRHCCARHDANGGARRHREAGRIIPGEEGSQNLTRGAAFRGPQGRAVHAGPVGGRVVP